MTPRILKTTALAAALALLAGCPTGEENNANNAPLPDASKGDDTGGADTGDDAGDDVGEDAGEDAGEAAFTCVKAWPSEATIPRTEGRSTVKMLTLCKGLPIEEVAALGARAVLKADPADDGLELDAQSVSGEAFRGEWIRVGATFDVPERWSVTDVVPFVSLTLGETALEASGPRTHQTEENLKEIHKNKGLLTTDEASNLAADNPIFQAPAGASTNILAKPAGGGTTVFTASLDQRTSMLKLNETPLGGGGSDVRGEFSLGGVDQASMVRANNPGGGSRLYVIAQCESTRAAPCEKPLAFGRATLNEAGEVTQSETLGGLDDVAEYPPAFFDGETLAYTELVSANGGGAKLRMLYAAREVNTDATVWVVVDAFDMSSSRTPRLRRVTVLDEMGGVTPQMVANGEATIGIVRSPEAVTLDPAEPVGNDQTILWVSQEAETGGTTFSMPFADEFEDVTFADVEPGTGAAHSVYWGGKDERALVLTGVNARRVPVDHIGSFNWKVTVENASYRPLVVSNTPLPAGATRQDVIVGGDDSNATTSLFAVVIGMNNTKEDKAAPLGAVLEGTEMNAVLFEGIGGDITDSTPYGNKGRAPIYLSEDPTSKGGSSIALPGGIAVLGAVDVRGCEVPGACDDLIARTETNFALLLDGAAKSCSGDDCGDDDGLLFSTNEGAATKRLFETSPGYAFLISKRARVFDTPDGAAVTLPFEYADGAGGLHLSMVNSDGEVTSSDPLSLTGGESTLVTQDTELLSFDGEDGVFVTPIDGVWTVGHMKADDNGGTGTATITLVASVEISYETASGQLKVPTACPMHHPSCALASARFAKAPSKAYQIDALNGDDAAGSVLDATFSAGAAPSPGVLMISEWDTGTACGLATLLYPSMDDLTADPIVVSTSNERDCGDLAIPVAVGDILGQGGEEFMLLRRSAEGGVASVVFVGEDAEGAQALYHMDLGEVGGALNVSRAGAARGVNVTDVDDDGLPDVSFDANIGVTGGDIVFQDDSRFDLLHTSGGGALRVDGKLQIPGLGVFGTNGVRGQAGGVQFSNGKGTKRAASSASGRPQLL